MNIMKVTLAVTSLMLATATAAEEDVKMKIQIALDDGNATGGIHLNLDSESMGFNLHDMQEGEIQSIIDESGRSILITREADGFKFDVDGKTIELPLFDAAHGAMWMDHDMSSDVNVHVIGAGNAFAHKASNGVTIISGKEVDEATREAIRSMLVSAGHVNGVEFIEMGHEFEELHEIEGLHEINGMHKTIVIKREIASTE